MDQSTYLLPTAPTISGRSCPAQCKAWPLYPVCELPELPVPAGFRKDGLPFGITLVAPPFHDDALALPAAAMHEAANCGAGTAHEKAGISKVPRT
jgi:Asp-tRNA(Asn)/Glu-tRNA(Gln) amidotransferase A subunit family amidase